MLAISLIMLIIISLSHSSDEVLSSIVLTQPLEVDPSVIDSIPYGRYTIYASAIPPSRMLNTVVAISSNSSIWDIHMYIIFVAYTVLPSKILINKQVGNNEIFWETLDYADIILCTK